MAQNILNIAQDNVGKVTGFRLDVVSMVRDGAGTDHAGEDVQLHLFDEVLEFHAEVRKELREHQLPGLYEMAEKYKPFVLIGGRLFPKIKKKLRENRINWIDAAGNMFVQTDEQFIYVDHQEAIKFEVDKDRAFTKTGLKVLFLFLQNETWLNKTYREIADAAGVALGTIGYVINGLKKRNYLVKKDAKTYQLVRKDKLIDDWITAYQTELQPKLHLGNYTFIDGDQRQNWKQLQLDGQTVWGGEAGGELLTGMLRPKELTMYTTHTRGELMKQYRLKPDKEGNIQVLEPYWKLDENKETAPPLAIYADLMLTGDERNYTIGQQIYEKFIQD